MFFVAKCFLRHQEAMRLTNTLDLVITESKERVYELEPGSVLGGKDNGHLCLTWKYSLKKASSDGGDKYRKNRFNFKKLVGKIGLKSSMEKVLVIAIKNSWKFLKMLVLSLFR